MTRHWIASRAAAVSGWKYAEPWSPSITVIVPPGRSIVFSRVSAPTGSGRCSSTKQTKTWSKVSGAIVNRSACRNSTFGSARARATASDSAETSIDVKRALGLRADSVTLWAPVPQPASSTRAPAG